ncbi:hypothetical protein BO70DRAFT_429978 [Aspergillus heteromorphus CBS 117.55]|uniref:Tat pathway signal sequence n=1 Tax=Aspergillus heteromorphus CBS 117.55 TaxID=1448321 RepID=A0A317W0M7_9EURO|nr:uncharacterized protein BO70DRAFT_429978 [Aspergillus heteromorphus CBS 117.55]PWY79171.1 hypothetical protein BO70DRAFT_429978 [Aspergillus heteromorphus CBS 117.55]
MADFEDEISRGSGSLEDEEKTSFLPRQLRRGWTKPSDQRQPWLWTLLLLNVLVLLCSLVTLFVAFSLRSGPSVGTERNALLKQTSAYSPILDEFDIPLKLVQSKLDFFDNSSIFSQLPSPEVDEAWEKIAPAKRVYLTTEQVIKLGKDPALTVRANNHPDRHIGVLNGMHELHCLNEIRRNLHRDYYWPDGIRSPTHWIHLYHCVDAIKQALTCSGNVDVVTFNWMEMVQEPFFDFSVNRVCRDFDRILEWQTENLGPLETDAWKVGGEVEIPAPPTLRAMNAQDSEARVFTHDDPALTGTIGV